MEEEIQQPQERSKRWIWIIVILILIVMGIGAYFLFTNPGAIISGPGSSIPQPPALPN